MILGLSHVALSCDDIEASTARLAAFGYGQRFDAPELENHAAKAPFLSRYQPRHHIRALSREGAMAIELLDHGSQVGEQAAALIPVFKSATPCPDWQARAPDELPIAAEGLDRLRVALGQPTRAFHDPVLSMTLLWICADGDAPGLHACALPTPDPEATATLLGQLRFRPDASGLWSLLTPLPALQARLIPVTARQAHGWTGTPRLDAPGCACLAFMARGTDHARLPAALQGHTVSFSLPINGKDSRITLARPDYGPMIELVDQTA